MKKSILRITFSMILIMIFCVGCGSGEADTSKTLEKDNKKIELKDRGLYSKSN